MNWNQPHHWFWHFPYQFCTITIFTRMPQWETFDHDTGELIRTLEQVLAGRSSCPRLLSAGASHFQHSHSLSLLKLCDPRSQRALLKSVSVKLSSTSLQPPSLSPLSKRSVTKHSSPGCSQGRCWVTVLIPGGREVNVLRVGAKRHVTHVTGCHLQHLQVSDFSQQTTRMLTHPSFSTH